jgi:hypothetical protein
LRVLPDLPVEHVREVGRFAKNQRLSLLDERCIRAPKEVFAALVRTLVGPLQRKVHGVIGDIEEHVGKPSLVFFHIPSVVIHGVVPYAPEGSYGYWNYQHRTRYPFAFLSADLAAAVPRLAEIEQALGRPGVGPLLSLKRDLRTPTSTLEPPDGLPPLTNTVVLQQGGAMENRRRLLNFGQRLRKTELFSSLSTAEAAVLATLMEPRQVETGVRLSHDGQNAAELLFIDSGWAKIRAWSPTGQPVDNVCGPGTCVKVSTFRFGVDWATEAIALTRITLRTLRWDTLVQYLGPIVSATTTVRAAEPTPPISSLRRCVSSRSGTTEPDRGHGRGE